MPLGAREGQLNPVIDAELASFMQRPVMIVAATRGADLRPAIGRGVGIRLSQDRALLDVLFSRAQWPGVTAAQTAGAAWALTLSDPADYRTFQIKGRLTEVAGAEPDDLALAGRYVATVTRALVDLGVQPGQAAYWFSTEDLVRVRLIPMSVFWQTPGARAGAALLPSSAGRA